MTQLVSPVMECWCLQCTCRTLDCREQEVIKITGHAGKEQSTLRRNDAYLPKQASILTKTGVGRLGSQTRLSMLSHKGIVCLMCPDVSPMSKEALMTFSHPHNLFWLQWMVYMYSKVMYWVLWMFWQSTPTLKKQNKRRKTTTAGEKHNCLCVSSKCSQNSSLLAILMPC